MLSTQILRPYQTEALAAVYAEWKKLRATLVVAATGTGKTIMFLALLDQLRREDRLTRALVLVHKIDLTTMPAAGLPGGGVKFNEAGLNILAYPITAQWQKGEMVSVWPEAYAKGQAYWPK